MMYSIIGAGSVGIALASQFARSAIPVGIANTRGPETMAPLVKDLGGTVTPLTLQQALDAEIILLAVPFWAHRDIVRATSNWTDKIVIDVTNAYGVPLDDLGDLPSSTVIARAFPDAQIVKAFNHLSAGVLAQAPATTAGRRVIFISSDHDDAASAVSRLVEQLGYAPVNLGKLAEGGKLVQARDKQWAPLIFQDLFKPEV